jgi:hypothetical protein
MEGRQVPALLQVTLSVNCADGFVQQITPRSGVSFHDFELLIRELSGFVQDGI